MPDAFRNSQANRPVAIKPPRAGADLNTQIQMALGHKPTGKSIKHFRPSLIGLPDKDEGFNPLKSISDAFTNLYKSITGEIHTVEESRQNLVSGVEQARQQFNASTDKKRVAILPTIELLEHPEKAVFKNTNITDSDHPDAGKNAVCNKRCEDYPGPEEYFCRANKWRAGCGHPGTNTDLASHDQDCSNFWGLGGLFDPLCTAGKGTIKAKDQYLVPIIIGGVIIIGIMVVMKR